MYLEAKILDFGLSVNCSDILILTSGLEAIIKPQLLKGDSVQLPDNSALSDVVLVRVKVSETLVQFDTYHKTTLSWNIEQK